GPGGAGPAARSRVAHPSARHAGHAAGLAPPPEHEQGGDHLRSPGRLRAGDHPNTRRETGICASPASRACPASGRCHAREAGMKIPPVVLLRHHYPCRLRSDPIRSRHYQLAAGAAALAAVALAACGSGATPAAAPASSAPKAAVSAAATAPAAFNATDVAFTTGMLQAGEPGR